MYTYIYTCVCICLCVCMYSYVCMYTHRYIPNDHSDFNTPDAAAHEPTQCLMANGLQLATLIGDWDLEWRDAQPRIPIYMCINIYIYVYTHHTGAGTFAYGYMCANICTWYTYSYLCTYLSIQKTMQHTHMCSDVDVSIHTYICSMCIYI